VARPSHRSQLVLSPRKLHIVLPRVHHHLYSEIPKAIRYRFRSRDFHVVYLLTIFLC
jgi:hypothetical protein